MDLEALVDRAQELAWPGCRVVLGIAGMPGAGKSTLAQALVQLLNARPAPDGIPVPGAPAEWAAYLPSDGYQLPQGRLVELGLGDRMGAPETLDAVGYAASVEAITADRWARVLAPGFDRAAQGPVPGAISIEGHHRLVVTEGTYLLLPDGVWATARKRMAQVWYVQLPDSVRVARLIMRHVESGKTPAAATEWVARSDQANARLVGAYAARADLVVPMD